MRFACVLKSLCDECTSVITSSETIGRPDRGVSEMQPVSLNGGIAEYMGYVFGDDFGDKYARLLQHFSHIVLPIHQKLSQDESFRRHVRVQD